MTFLPATRRQHSSKQWAARVVLVIVFLGALGAGVFVLAYLSARATFRRNHRVLGGLLDLSSAQRFDQGLVPPSLGPHLTWAERRHVAQLRLAPAHTPFTDAVREYLGHHRVWLSCTTSPERLRALTGLLEILRLDGVAGIVVNLPSTYRPTGEPYADEDVAYLRERVPLARVHRIATDWGPVCKILPTLELVDDPDDTIITLDDDTLLPPDTVARLLNASVGYEGAYAVATVGQRWKHWKIDPPTDLRRLEPSDRRSPRPARVAGSPLSPGLSQRIGRGCPAYKPVERAYGGSSPAFVDVTEGFAGVAFRRRHLEASELEVLSQLSRATRLSDDMILSLHLERNQVPRVRLTKKPDAVVQLAYGFGQDALHARYENTLKYQQTVHDVAAWVAK